MMTRRHFAAVAAAALGSGLVLDTAYAMDPFRPERPMRMVLMQHFEGVAQGNADALSAVWAAGAQVQHVEVNDKGQEVVKSEPAADAIARWTRDPDLFAKGKVLSVQLVSEHIAYATVEFTWRNTRHVELFSMLLAGGSWRITNKLYQAFPTRDAKPNVRGGY